VDTIFRTCSDFRFTRVCVSESLFYVIDTGSMSGPATVILKQLTGMIFGKPGLRGLPTRVALFL
jgi:hypothetical protein